MVLLGATAAVSVAMVLDAVAASPATGTLAVSATVVNNCQFTTTPVAFGNYDPAVVNAAGGANLLATGNLLVTCTTGDSITVDLDAGGNPSQVLIHLSFITTLKPDAVGFLPS